MSFPARRYAATLALCLLTAGALPHPAVTAVQPGEVLVRFTKPPKVSPPADKAPGALWQYVAADKQVAGARMPLIEYLGEQGLTGLEPLVHAAPGKAAKQPDDLRPDSPIHRLVFPPDADVDAIVEHLRKSAGVVWAEPNQRGTLAYTPSDPLFAQQQPEFDVVGLRAAWDVQQGADASVRVAVIDSGTDAVHPELAGALDLAASYNFVDNNATVADDRGHGTRVAGLIGAASNNAEGIAGAAFGCTILSLDVTDREGAITSANVISALQWAIANDADVANLSLTFQLKSTALEEACNAAVDAGMLLVAAAGNENQGASPVYPASYDAVLGVGAVLDTGTARAPWSNFNGTDKTLVDLVAPGDTMFSTIPGSQYNGTYGSGTSFAAPVVSGAAALLKARYPDQPGAALGAHLRATASPLGDWAGDGLLDAAAALATPLVPDITVASVTIDDDPSYGGANDGDGIFDAGESVKLVVALSSSKAAVANVTAVLSTASPHVTALGDASANYALIGHATTSVNDADPFGLVSVDAAAPAGDIAFTLDLSGPDGFAASVPVTVRLDNLFTAPLIIDQDMTWTKDKTWVIEQGCVVLEGATLTIEPGTTVRFADVPGRDNKLEVRGGVIAEGTEEEKITFTSMDGMPFGDFVSMSLPVGLGDGSGAYQSLAVGDVDGDGINELVTSNNYPDPDRNVSLIRWNGSFFEPEIRLQTFDAANFVAIGDVDGNGIDDIVTSNGSGRLSVLRWNGSIFPILSRPTLTNILEGIVADPDRDGVSEILGIAVIPSDAVELIAWDGSNFLIEDRLAPPVAGDFVQSVRVDDVDNDGFVEVLAHHWDWLAVWEWTGSGFAPPITLPMEHLRHVTIGDVDGDGDNDIVTGHVVYPSKQRLVRGGSAGAPTGAIRVNRWNGTGWDEEEILASDHPVYFVEVGDVDDDGDNDIVYSEDGVWSEDYETLVEPAYWKVLLWNGIGFDAPRLLPVPFNEYIYHSLVIADADTDGRDDILALHTEIVGAPPDEEARRQAWVLRWDRALAPERRHGGLWIRQWASRADFRHAAVRFAPVLDDSSVGHYEDCLFDRTGETYSLSALAGTTPLVRCTVLGNDGGDGIRAGNRELVDCVAEDNAGTGLLGGTLTRCIARRNGIDGMAGAAAVDSIADFNTGNGIKVTGTVDGSHATGNGVWGIDAGGAVSSSTATSNVSGIKGTNLSLCTATANTSTGLQPSGTATNCRAVGNGGAGIAGNSLTDCVVLGNATGLQLTGTALRGYIAQNAGEPAVTGGTLDSTVVLHNEAGGTGANLSVLNSWVVGNGGAGITGLPAAPFTPVQSSAAWSNGGVGIQAAGPVNNSILFGNTGYDYRETRSSSLIANVDATGNYWGPETTAFMDAHPFGPGTTGNVPAIFDLRDNLSLGQVNYGGHRATLAGAGPDTAPPAFLLAAGTDDADPLGAGVHELLLTYSEPMDTAAPLSVTFGQEAPFDTHVVEPDPGWQSPTTWRGSFVITPRTADGTQTLRVAGALALDGFSVPDDTAHTFSVDGSGQGSANNGIVGSIGDTTGLNISWTENGRPAGAQGYNLLATPPEGLTETQLITGDLSMATLSRRVNSSLLATNSVDDTGLTPGRYHIYAVTIVDGSSNSVPWTDLFYGYLPPVPGNSVQVAVTPDTASWSFTDATGGVHTGTGDAVRSGIPTGTVTMTWGVLANHDTPVPNPATASVPNGGTATFTGVYNRHTGSVSVNVTPDTASWSFTDGDGGAHTGTGDATRTGIPTGTISLTWQPLPGHGLPPLNPEAKTLSKGGTVNFTGVYPPAGPDEDLWMVY